MKTKLLSLLLSLIMVLSCFAGVFSVSAEDLEADEPADYDELAAAEGYVARIGDQETAYADGAFTGYYKFLTDSQLGYGSAKKENPSIVSAHVAAATAGPETVVYLIADITTEMYNNSILINASLTLDGQGYTVTGNWNQKTIDLQADNITLRNMTIWQQGQHGCIQQSKENISTVCENVLFYSTGNVPYAAVIMNKGTNAMVLNNCVILMETDEYASGGRAATAVRNHFDGGYLEMNNCVVDTSGAIGRTGIYTNGGAKTVLNNCTVTANAMAVSTLNGNVTINDGSYASVTSEYYYQATTPSKGFFPPHPVISTEMGGLEINGSVTFSGANAPILSGYEYYYQTKANTTTGVQDTRYEAGKTSYTYVGADDAAAIAEGYIARVGLITDAVEKDDKGNTIGYPGYYKTLDEAIAAAEGETVTLLADIDATASANLTLKAATINGAGHTLTAKRLYKETNAELIVKNLNIKTTDNQPILQMNAGEGFGYFINCTFETEATAPYAYFVLRNDLMLENCTVKITNATCDKPIFRVEKGCEVSLSGTKVDTHETAPNLTGFHIVDDEGAFISLAGNTHMYVGKYGITSDSKANATFYVYDNAIFQSVDNALVVPESGTDWFVEISDNAQVISDTKVAVKLGGAGAYLDVYGEPKIIGAREALSVTAEAVNVNLGKGATVELKKHDNNNAAILLSAAAAQLTTEANIVTDGGVALSTTGADCSVLIKGGDITGTVSIGATDAPANLVMMGGTITAPAEAAAAITVNEGTATILAGLLSGGAKAITGTKEVAYADGETSIALNDLETNLPETLGTSMRMNDGSLGMRFTSLASKELIDFANGLLEAGVIMGFEMGTLITRETEVRQREMTVEALAAEGVVFAEVAAENGRVVGLDGSITYTAAIINFTEDNMGTAFTARAYAKYIMTDGTEIYVYADNRTEGISIGELAQDCLADVSVTREEGYKNIADSYYEIDEDGWYDIVFGTVYSPYSKEQREALKAFIEGADL